MSTKAHVKSVHKLLKRAFTESKKVRIPTNPNECLGEESGEDIGEYLGEYPDKYFGIYPCDDLGEYLGEYISWRPAAHVSA